VKAQTLLLCAWYAVCMASVRIITALLQRAISRRQVIVIFAQRHRKDPEEELMDEEQGMSDALAVIEEYSGSTEERYRKFRYTWPRTAEEDRVEAARQTAKRFWQKAQWCALAWGS
jgi:hypothetical protein